MTSQSMSLGLNFAYIFHQSWTAIDQILHIRNFIKAYIVDKKVREIMETIYYVREIVKTKNIVCEIVN